MTRQKKSRKTGPLGSKSQPKNMREHKDPDASKKPAKNKGKPPGNRHSIEPAKQQAGDHSSTQKDPRVGSKRKIELKVPESKPAKTAPAVTEKVTAQVVPGADLAGRQSVSPAVAQAEDEFAKLENDPRLQELLAQLDAGDELSKEDNTWVEQQLTRYQQLADELGIDSDELEGDDEDDDDLEPWQKFDNPKDWV